MKKIFGLMLSLLCISFFFVSAQEIYVEEEVVEVTTPVETETPQKNNKKQSEGQSAAAPFILKDYAHWSVSLDAGFNVFQGDMEPDFKVLYKEPFKHWTLGANVEYTINPLFSVGIGYKFSKVASHDNQAEQGGEKVDRGQFKSNIHHIYPMVGVDILNFPLFNRNVKWDFWIHAGLGAAHYNSELQYMYNPNLASNTKYTEDEWYSEGNPGYSKGSKWVPVVPVSFEISYSITKQFIIGLKYQVDFYMWDAMEGAVKLQDLTDPYGRKRYAFAGSSNDALSNFLLNLRWDITPGDKTHIRKLTWKEFKMQPPRDSRIDDLAKRLDSLENQLANIDVTPVMIPVVGADCNCDQVPLAVYFDFDKYNLDREALIVIRQVVYILNANPDYTVEVRGYTDIKGSNTYNNKLSQRRAEAIKDELVKIWNIAPERIVANGEGKATEPVPTDPKYHPINRRCDFFFIKE